MGTLPSKPTTVLVQAPPPPFSPPPSQRSYQPLQFLDKDRKEEITGFRRAMFKTMANAWVSSLLILFQNKVYTFLIRN